jgi:hypothetical protein
MPFIAAYTWSVAPQHDAEFITRSSELRAHEERLGAVISGYRVGSGANEGQIVFTATFDTAAQHATWFEAVTNDSESAKILAELGDHDGWAMTSVDTYTTLAW